MINQKCKYFFFDKHLTLKITFEYFYWLIVTHACPLNNFVFEARSFRLT